MQQKLIPETFKQIWARDKQLLAMAAPHSPQGWDKSFKWDGEMPDGYDLGAILHAETLSWLSPKVELDTGQESLSACVNSVIGEVESAWQEKFSEAPDVEIVPPADFLPRIRELDSEVTRRFGTGYPIESPPTMIAMPYYGKVVAPSMFVARETDGEAHEINDELYDITKPAERVHHLKWGKHHFEISLFEELSHLLFRQLRGELKEGYVASISPLGTHAELKISVLNEVLALHIREAIARTTKPEWGLDVVSSKAHFLWTDRLRMDTYRGVDALARNLPVSAIALLDDVGVNGFRGDSAVFSFNGYHLCNDMKQRRFRELASTISV